MKINPPHLLLIFRYTFAVALTVTTWLALVDTTSLPDVTLNIWDKFQHAAAFLVLSFLLHGSFTDKRLYSTLYFVQISFLICYGILIECLQRYVPSRESSLTDVLADIVGILCFSVLFYLKIRAGKNTSQRG